MNKILIYILTMLLVSGCVDEEMNTSNHAPEIKSFKVKPAIAQPGVKISFEADDIMDVEDSKDSLQVCWSFLGDQTFTDFTLVKNAEYTYQDTGCYFPILKVKDTKSLTKINTMVVVIVNDTNNKPPSKPELIAPTPELTVIGKDVTFKWKCVSDPENDPVSYNLWIGHVPYDLQKVSIDVNVGSIIEATLSIKDYSTYYWAVSAKDTPNCNYSFSEIRKFKLSSE